jgi:hypothetical protein
MMKYSYPIFHLDSILKTSSRLVFGPLAETTKVIGRISA